LSLQILVDCRRGFFISHTPFSSRGRTEWLKPVQLGANVLGGNNGELIVQRASAPFFQVFLDLIVSFSMKFSGGLKSWEIGPNSLSIPFRFFVSSVSTALISGVAIR